MNRESKAKHTPAPWRAEEGYDNTYNQSVIEISSDTTEQFITIWSGQDYVDDTTKANARLIAEAPTLKGYLSSARVVLARMRRSMMAHPDHEVGSEFDDLTTESQILEDEIIELIKKIE